MANVKHNLFLLDFSVGIPYNWVIPCQTTWKKNVFYVLVSFTYVLMCQMRLIILVVLESIRLSSIESQPEKVIVAVVVVILIVDLVIVGLVVVVVFI